LSGATAPRWFEPMKAVLSDEPFSDPGWVFERKLDGIRCIAIRDGDDVTLLSRTKHSLNERYPEIADALRSDPCERFAIDGEVVAFKDGITSFARLQQRGQARVAIFYYVFDAVHLDGEDVEELPLRERKARLRKALAFKGPVRFSTHHNERGEEMFREACRKGLEGIMAKRADSPYRHGRSRDWLKLKCSHEQELVIGGFTAPQGSRTDFGALLVGYNEDGKLSYAGKVGTGFDRHTLSDLGGKLRELEIDSSPFDRVHPVPRGTHWVEPELVAQIGFTEWTRDGRLRHPRYLGLRDDKPASEVVRERPS
jgi:DNA ligase D-like protein (predicted ligase)